MLLCNRLFVCFRTHHVHIRLVFLNPILLMSYRSTFFKMHSQIVITESINTLFRNKLRDVRTNQVIPTLDFLDISRVQKTKAIF